MPPFRNNFLSLCKLLITIEMTRKKYGFVRLLQSVKWRLLDSVEKSNYRQRVSSPHKSLDSSPSQFGEEFQHSHDLMIFFIFIRSLTGTFVDTVSEDVYQVWESKEVEDGHEPLNSGLNNFSVDFGLRMRTLDESLVSLSLLWLWP